MKKCDLIRYHGNDKRIWYGKLLSVREVNEGTLTVYHERKPNGKWTTIKIAEADAEEVA